MSDGGLDYFGVFQEDYSFEEERKKLVTLKKSYDEKGFDDQVDKLMVACNILIEGIVGYKDNQREYSTEVNKDAMFDRKKKMVDSIAKLSLVIKTLECGDAATAEAINQIENEEVGKLAEQECSNRLPDFDLVDEVNDFVAEVLDNLLLEFEFEEELEGEFEKFIEEFEEE